MIDIKDCKVFSVLVCPGCGSEDAGLNHVGNSGTCSMCGMNFVLSSDIRSNVKLMYASRSKAFTPMRYQWKAVFITHSVPPAWRARGMCFDNPKKAKISKRMAGRWDAHLVAIALGAKRKEGGMSYLKKLNHDGLANILICPNCGSESFTPEMENSLKCDNCEFWFLFTSVNTNFGMKANRTVYASFSAMRSKDDWDWKLVLREDSVKGWATWDERHDKFRKDKRSYEEVCELMNNKWEAYKVAVALTSNFKK